jgi:hypothetical protein
MRGAQHVAERHAGQRDVIDIAAAAAQQPRILEPGHALTHRKLTHRIPRIDQENACRATLWSDDRDRLELKQGRQHSTTVIPAKAGIQ